MTTLAIFTTTRAEFGLLSPLIDAVIDADDMDYLLFVGGGHFMKSQGDSLSEIVARGYEFIPFNYQLEEDSEEALSTSLSVELSQLSQLFNEYSFDYTMVLGDRIELLPIVQAAIVYRKPIVHLHGGEVTMGAVDEQVRHMITKSAHLHFCAAEEYKENILKMGEEAWRVHNIGALGVDSIVRNKAISREELFGNYNLDPSKPVGLMTYHPVTLEFELSIEEQINRLFEALNQFTMQLIVTAPNMDQGNHLLFERIQQEVDHNPGYRFIPTMGITRYQSMLKYVAFVIGNSSSGILEAPFYKVPTINIGDRQKGRMRHRSIIDCDYSTMAIEIALRKSLDSKFLSSLVDMEYKFGSGKSAQQILEILGTLPPSQKLMQKKLDFAHA
jgi:GDP/UDP-N,N'-diacetylbacillosamine 2-epimerase (hydrolysing)